MVFKTIRLDEIIKGKCVAIAEKGPRFQPWVTFPIINQTRRTQEMRRNTRRDTSLKQREELLKDTAVLNDAERLSQVRFVN